MRWMEEMGKLPESGWLLHPDSGHVILHFGSLDFLLFWFLVPVACIWLVPSYKYPLYTPHCSFPSCQGVMVSHLYTCSHTFFLVLSSDTCLLLWLLFCFLLLPVTVCQLWTDSLFLIFDWLFTYSFVSCMLSTVEPEILTSVISCFQTMTNPRRRGSHILLQVAIYSWGAKR